MGQNRRTQDRERAARAVVRRTERVQVILPADELAAIEDFRFQARMPSRSAAIRELLRRGMARASRAGRA
jgi:metal-responsive CopG/Arc/MetJ family transcriptional regulator